MRRLFVQYHDRSMTVAASRTNSSIAPAKMTTTWPRGRASEPVVTARHRRLSQLVGLRAMTVRSRDRQAVAAGRPEEAEDRADSGVTYWYV